MAASLDRDETESDEWWIEPIEKTGSPWHLAAGILLWGLLACGLLALVDYVLQP